VGEGIFTSLVLAHLKDHGIHVQESVY
jgi:hypothetical protein